MDHLVDSLASHLGLTAGVGAATAVATTLTALGAFHAEIAATEVLAVQLFDQRVGNLLVVDVGKTETAAGAGFAVQDGFEANPFPHRLEQSCQLLFIKGLRQVADVQADAHEGRRMRFVGAGPSSLTHQKS